MKTNKIYGTLTACSLACSLASCGLVYDYPEPCGDIDLSIVNDWRKSADASPEGMAYFFFPEDNKHAWRFDFPGKQAGKVSIPEGRYSFISYNDDTYRVQFTGNTYKTLKATTWEALLPSDTGNGQSVAESAEKVWTCDYYMVEIDYDEVSYYPYGYQQDNIFPIHSKEKILVASQRQITPHYRLVIDDVENLDGVKTMSAALSGMARSYIIWSDTPDDYPSTISFDTMAQAETRIEGEFYTFGLPVNVEAPNILYLFITLMDGRSFMYRFDVTDQVRQAPDRMSVLIELHGLVLEKNETTGTGGFDVAVDGWTTVDVNIND